jgi:hypothetical protein
VKVNCLNDVSEKHAVSLFNVEVTIVGKSETFQSVYVSLKSDMEAVGKNVSVRE